MRGYFINFSSILFRLLNTAQNLLSNNAQSLSLVMTNFYKDQQQYISFKGGVSMDIDREFEEYVSKNYKKLTVNQKQMCKKLGICVDQ